MSTKLMPCEVCGELHQEESGRCLKHLPETKPAKRKKDDVADDKK